MRPVLMPAAAARGPNTLRKTGVLNMPLVIATQALLDQMDLVATAYSTGGADALTMHLYNNDVNPGTGMLLTDFTEADFVGYASAALNFTVGPYLNPVGQ